MHEVSSTRIVEQDGVCVWHVEWRDGGGAGGPALTLEDARRDMQWTIANAANPGKAGDPPWLPSRA